MLKDVLLAPGFPMRLLAEHAKGKSGSDLKELCRNAAMLPIREFVRKANGDVALLARGQEEVRFFASFLHQYIDALCYAGLQSSFSYDRGLFRSRRHLPNS